ncbi:hypothetical protein KZZ08_08790 [Roseovarius mucosus]|jgi:hypothetical protein|nr:hypothetical protein [Roseovarius sp.]MBW4973712.1 hypothetical protein [Roseovarius mucosus]
MLQMRHSQESTVMAYSSHSNVPAPGFGNVGRFVLAPLRLIDGFFKSVVAANRFAHEVETLSMASDQRLAALGLKRDTLVADLAARSDLFRAA